VSKSPSDHPLSPQDKRTIQVLLWALKPLINLRSSIPLPFVTVFLMVALDEGQGVNEYARMVGIHRAAMSRYLRNIGARARYGGPGLGLVTIEPHPTDPVRKRVFLTTKGRSIARKIFQQLRKVSNRKACEG
jgi:DNA-binding MarR family transcriptional regulator